ncbi:hypothetical protein RUR49_19690 [Pseudoxanthobacter sp. M-2]
MILAAEGAMVAFDSDHAQGVAAPFGGPRRAPEWTLRGEKKGMPVEDHDQVLARIAELLASGLETMTEPFPETEKEFSQILRELRELPAGDLEQKLVIGGFVDHPYGEEEQRCLECMYYLVHRKWCDLPELAVPVEPHWWCRLWRI